MKQPGPPDTPRQAARRQQLADITHFIMLHDLEINSFTLSVAVDYLTGSSKHLLRAIDQRMQDRRPLTETWLEDAARLGKKDEHEAMHRLMQRMETDIDEFSAATSHAKSATTDYHQALAAHVDDLGHPAGRRRSTTCSTWPAPCWNAPARWNRKWPAARPRPRACAAAWIRPASVPTTTT
jgi:hypothetical protein